MTCQRFEMPPCARAVTCGCPGAFACEVETLDAMDETDAAAVEVCVDATRIDGEPE